MSTLQSLNATYRFSSEGPTYKDGPADKPVMGKPGRTLCHIIDLTTKIEYFSAEGGTEAEALKKAIDGAIKAEKPMTPAQAFSKQAVDLSSKITDQGAEIAKLKAELASTQSQLAEAKRPKRGARADEEPVT